MKPKTRGLLMNSVSFKILRRKHSKMLPSRKIKGKIDQKFEFEDKVS